MTSSRDKRRSPSIGASPLGVIRQEQPFGVVDYGTAYAKAIVVHFGPASSWNLVGAGSICYGSRQTRASLALGPEQQQAATEALRQAQSRSLSLSGRLIAPKAVVVSVPADMLTLQTYRWEMKRRRPLRPVDASEAADSLSQAHNASLSQAASHMYDAASPGRPVWLGTVWSAWFVDRRSVTSAAGFRGETIAVSTTQATTSTAALDSLRNMPPSFAAAAVFLPEPLGIAELLRRRQPCLLFDAGAQRTGVYLRSADGNLHCTSVATGGHHFNRWLSLAGGLSPSRAEKVKLAYAEGRLHPRGSLRVRAVVQRAYAAWAKRLVAALDTAGWPLPGAWYATGGHSHLPEWAALPGIVADASMSRLERYPNLEPLPLDDCAGPIVSGPERLQPCHSVAWGLAQYLVRLSHDEQALAELRQASALAAKAGFEVSSEWLT